MRCIRETRKRRADSETHWKRSAWKCRHCLSSAGRRPRSRPWSQSLHPGTNGAAGGEIRKKKTKTKLQTSWLILPQKRQESAFQSVTETITTSIQPNQLTSQNQVFEIWSKGYKMKRWSTGKQQKTIFTENYKYHNTKRTMEPSRHSKPQHLTSMTVGSERSILFSVGREENLENVPFYPLSRNLIQLHTHTKEGRGTEDINTLHLYLTDTLPAMCTPHKHTHTPSSYLKRIANYIIKCLQAFPVLRLLLLLSAGSVWQRKHNSDSQTGPHSQLWWSEVTFRTLHTAHESRSGWS